MEYLFNREGTIETVQLEKWVWGVVYKDDTELHQFGSKGDFHQFKEIKKEEVKMFTMYKSDDMSKRIDLLITPEMSFFHFYRNIRPEWSEVFIKIYVFGFAVKDKQSGMLEKTFMFILPDDRILVSNRDNIDLSLFDLGRK